MSSPFRIITVASNKGGVGKTTLATNLAVYLRALREDLPVLLLGLDDQDLIDRMFAPNRAEGERTAFDVLSEGELGSAARLGHYGVYYIPTSPLMGELRGQRDPFLLRQILEQSGWRGLVVIDTPGDLGILTCSALSASDLALLVVSDRSSLDQLGRIHALLREWGRPAEATRVVLSLVDLRVKFRDRQEGDILGLLVSEIRRRGFPLLESFISRSPKIESLATNPEGIARTILHGARGTLIDRQMAHLARDVLQIALADAAGTRRRDERRRLPRRRFARRLAAFCDQGPPVVALSALDLSAEGMAITATPGLGLGQRVHVALSSPAEPDPFLVWARVAREDAEGRQALRFEAGSERLTRLLDALPAETP